MFQSGDLVRTNNISIESYLSDKIGMVIELYENRYKVILMNTNIPFLFYEEELTPLNINAKCLKQMLSYLNE